MGICRSRPAAVAASNSSKHGGKESKAMYSRNNTVTTNDAYKDLSRIEKRMHEAITISLARRKNRGKTNGGCSSFDRIILRFPLLRKSFSNIRDVFTRFDDDGNGSIDKSELGHAMEALGAKVNDDLLEEMFDECDMTKTGILTLQEFLLALCIGSVLQLFPLVESVIQDRRNSEVMTSNQLSKTPEPQEVTWAGSPCPTNSEQIQTNSEQPDSTVNTSIESKHVGESNTLIHASSAPESKANTSTNITIPTRLRRASATLTPRAMEAEIQQAGVSLQVEAQRIVYALRVALDAYLLFDDNGDGFIQKNEVFNTISERTKLQQRRDSNGGIKGHHSRSPGMTFLLSKDRWEELDWDDDGRITLKEFLYAFYSWVGVEDADDDEQLQMNTAQNAVSTASA